MKTDTAKLLDLKPIRSSRATTDRRADGGAVVKVPTRTTRLFRAPADAKKAFELDEIGLLVWDQCDGKTPVERIVRTVAEKYRLNLRETEVATRKFLDMLAQRNLIGAAPEGA